MIRFGDVVKCDKGQGVIEKVDGLKAKVKLNDTQSSIWRDLAKLSLVESAGGG